MKTKFLIHNKYKKWGWILLGLAVVLGVLESAFEALSFLNEVSILAVYDSGFIFDEKEGPAFFRVIVDDFQFELISTLFIVGALMVSFSRLKNEDEYIAKVRLESLVWATFFHFLTVIIFTLAVYGSAYFNVMLINMVSILVLFILKFHVTLYIKERAS